MRNLQFGPDVGKKFAICNVTLGRGDNWGGIITSAGLKMGKDFAHTYISCEPRAYAYTHIHMCREEYGITAYDPLKYPPFVSSRCAYGPIKYKTLLDYTERDNCLNPPFFRHPPSSMHTQLARARENKVMCMSRRENGETVES